MRILRGKTYIPKKNYIKFYLIVIFTIIVGFVFFFSYEKYKEYKSKIPFLRGMVSEIEVSELDDYLTENDKAILYVGVANDKNSRELEQDLSYLIEKTGIRIVYLNITDLVNKVDFYKDFNSRYSSGVSLSNYPAVVLIQDKKIVDLVERGYSYLTLGSVQQLFDTYEVRTNNYG